MKHLQVEYFPPRRKKHNQAMRLGLFVVALWVVCACCLG